MLCRCRPCCALVLRLVDWCIWVGQPSRSLYTTTSSPGWAGRRAFDRADGQSTTATTKDSRPNMKYKKKKTNEIREVGGHFGMLRPRLVLLLLLLLVVFAFVPPFSHSSFCCPDVFDVFLVRKLTAVQLLLNKASN